MTHITATTKEEITRLRAAGKSHRQIAKELSMPLGSVKGIIYAGKPPAPPPKRAADGQFKTRSPAGRKPAGATAQSDKARAAAYRQRKRERLEELAGNLQAANDGELANLLVLAVRTGDTNMVKGITSELHTRHCSNSVTVTKSISGVQHGRI